MSAITDVYLITGFLGSGKTTFLNRIIQGFSKECSLMILMNEFGDTGVDGTLVDGDDLTMLEISKGSIFLCLRQDRFYQRPDGYRPPYSTGRLDH